LRRKNATFILLLTRFLVNRLVFWPSVAALTAHCQARLSGFNRRMAAKAFALLVGSITVIAALRSISVRHSARDKSYE
jgi:hypothetical protein